MPGPLPDPNARRRNAPTIPTTNLPASGRHGPVPKVPKWVELGAAGKGWWAWAWKTPQAAGWSDGNIPMVAQRASLEDDLASLAEVEGLDFADVDPTGNTAELRRTVQRVAALARRDQYREVNWRFRIGTEWHRFLPDSARKATLAPKAG